MTEVTTSGADSDAIFTKGKSIYEYFDDAKLHDVLAKYEKLGAVQELFRAIKAAPASIPGTAAQEDWFLRSQIAISSFLAKERHEAQKHLQTPTPRHRQRPTGALIPAF